MNAYLADYNDNVYTWHTCHHYSYDMGNMDCDVTNLDFASCNGADIHPGIGGCNTAGYLQELNDYKPWYTYDGTAIADYNT